MNKTTILNGELGIVGRFLRLQYGHILGVVDSYGAVHSVFTGDSVRFHAEYFPQHHCQWRWDFEGGISWISEEIKPDAEEMESIRWHLTKRYGLQWWENGHHDINHLQKKWIEETENSCPENQKSFEKKQEREPR
jgi:hypothetical protein